VALALKADHFRKGSMLSKNAAAYLVFFYRGIFGLFQVGRRSLIGKQRDNLASLLRNRRSGSCHCRKLNPASKWSGAIRRQDKSAQRRLLADR
jgi:hypothetical protein